MRTLKSSRTKLNYMKRYSAERRKTPGYKAWHSAYLHRRRQTNDLAMFLAKTREVAKRRGHEFDLTSETFPTVPTHCPVLGIKLDRDDNDSRPSLDRIDNTRGYVDGNVRWVSYKWNRMKGDHNLTTALLLVRDLSGNWPQRKP